MITSDKFNSDFPPLRLGVIGAGQISQIILPMLPKQVIMVTGITDLNPTAAHALDEKMGSPRIYPDSQSLLAAQDVEAVYIATPPNTHKPLTLAAMKAG